MSEGPGIYAHVASQHQTALPDHPVPLLPSTPGKRGATGKPKVPTVSQAAKRFPLSASHLISVPSVLRSICQTAVSVDHEATGRLPDSLLILCHRLLPQQINQDLNIQLLKDGYRLDEIPDDEDLDLIPPKAVNPTCMCCQAAPSTACQIQ